jgi:hypothetical protein
MGKWRSMKTMTKADLYWQRERHDWPERGLPVPRLELVWTASYEHGWKRREALYVLVYRHYSDDKLVARPLGLTRVDGGLGGPPVNRAGCVDTPFREGVHIRADAAQLNLPAFAVVVEGDNVMTHFTQQKPLEKP